MLTMEGILQYARKGRYGALHDGCFSDYTMLWEDFDLKAFFGGLGPKHVPPQASEFSVHNE